MSGMHLVPAGACYAAVPAEQQRPWRATTGAGGTHRCVLNTPTLGPGWHAVYLVVSMAVPQ